MPDCCDFWHIHNHSYFSQGDALPFPPTMANNAFDKNQNAIALTDHGTMNGLIYLWLMVNEWNKDNLKASGFLPVMGCEFYTVKHEETYKDKETGREHLIVLARDWEGYKAMVKMSRYGYDHHHHRPLVSHDLLQEMSDAGITEHLIATSACPISSINKELVWRGEDAAENELEWFKSIFPNFYIELMDHSIDSETYSHPEMENPLGDKDRNLALYEIAKRTGTPYVFSNDSHYKDKEDAYAHDMYLSLTNRQKYSGHGYWIRTEDEMREAFEYFDDKMWREGIDGLLEIREKCSDFTSPTFFTEDDKVKWHLPEISDDDRKLRDLCIEGIDKRIEQGWLNPDNKQDHLDRIDEELDVIQGAGFSSYFLMVSEYVRWAKHESPCSWFDCGKTEADHGDEDHPYFGIMVGPGRGSVCGCDVAYLTEITDVDPLKYNLVFERFLDREKVKYEVPDIDIDFQDDRRDEVIDHVREVYGPENVTHVPNWGRRQEAGAWKAAAQAMGVNYHLSNRISAMIHDWPSEEGDKLDPEPVRLERLFSQSTLDNPEIPQEFKDVLIENPQLEYLALKFFKTLKNVGTHAAAVLICPPGLLESMDHQTRSGEGGEVVSGFAYGEHNQLGLVKNDFLGLRNLKTIQETRKHVWRLKGVDILEDLNADHDKFECQEVYEMLTKGDTQGVFQYEGGAFAPLCKKLGVRDFSDMVDINALARPGPNQFVDIYHDAKFSGKKFDYPHPAMEDIFERTYGILIFEEQVLKLAQDVAELDGKYIPKVKKAIKYYIDEVMNDLGPEFKRGLIENGKFSEEDADEWWSRIQRFSGYGFNSSHCVAYSMIGYWTAWCKVNHPTEYMAALIATSGETSRYIPIIKGRGIELLPPDINESLAEFTPIRDGVIRFGLVNIKDVGWKACEQIMRGQPFDDNEEFWRWYEEGLSDEKPKPDRRSLTKKAIENLKKIGAMECIDEIWDYNSDDERGEIEMELTGCYISYDPMEQYREMFQDYIYSSENQIKLNSGQEEEKTCVGGVITRTHEHPIRTGNMCFINVELDEQEWSIVLWPNIWNKIKDQVNEGDVIMALGKWQPDRESLLGYKIRTKREIHKKLEAKMEKELSSV